jgi:hypothetical protein
MTLLVELHTLNLQQEEIVANLCPCEQKHLFGIMGSLNELPVSHAVQTVQRNLGSGMVASRRGFRRDKPRRRPKWRVAYGSGHTFQRKLVADMTTNLAKNRRHAVLM